MTDDNQEMEDILSSIKDILEEDEKNQQNSRNLTSESDVLEGVLSGQETDDVLELSQDMRIVEEEKIPVAELPELPDEMPVVEAESSANVAEDSEPIIESAIDPEPISTPEPTVEIEETAEAVVEQTPEPMEAVEDAAELESEVELAPVDEPIEPAFEAEPVAESEQKQADVSEGIISNFAKMFAHEEEGQAVTPSAEHITTVGDASKSLEDFVRDAVIKVVGEEIQKQWNNGSDYKTFAEAEIKRQTTEWINNNLSTMVETIIKQEITRVIAKVGS